MKDEKISLSPSEWQVMEALWEKAPATGRELTDAMETKVGWSRSTTLTLLRRLEQKGAVTVDTTGPKSTFSPLISRKDAARRETEDFLSRVYHGSLSLMVSSLTEKEQLTPEETGELERLLKKLEGGT